MKNFKKTLNNTGFARLTVDPMVSEFVTDAKSQNDYWSLEIGAGVGTDTSAIINSGAKLYCNDLDANHMQIIREKLDNHPHLKLLVGDFLSLQFEHNSLHSIYASRVLHFLTPAEIKQAFILFHHWLKKDGKLFVTMETPFLKNWQKFIPEFEKRKQDNIDFPGFINNPRDFESSGFSEDLPTVVHWFDVDTLSKISTQHGFIIDRVHYVDRKNDFPQQLLLDGRESVAGIFIKK